LTSEFLYFKGTKTENKNIEENVEIWKSSAIHRGIQHKAKRDVYRKTVSGEVGLGMVMNHSAL